MRRKMTERVRRVLAMLLVGSLLAMFAGALPVAADDLPNPVRILPATVVPGELFEVQVTFTAPVDGFVTIVLRDRAPAGWTVYVNAAWCDPEPDLAYTPDGLVNYEWGMYSSYDEGTPFAGVYKVQVPEAAEPGEYSFELEEFLYYIDADDVPNGPHTAVMGGQDTVIVAEPDAATGEVGLRARTPATGSMKLIKLFDKPDEVEFPDDEIEVRVTGPDDFDETYVLTRDGGWEKIIDGLAPGTYLVQEVDPPAPWMPSYDPEGRLIEVVSGTEPGPEATMTITNTYSVVGVSVSPSDIDFGEIHPGETMTGDTITVTNTGTLNIDVDAVLAADTKYDADNYLYTRALKLNEVFSDRHSIPTEFGAWTATDLGLVDIAPGSEPGLTTELVCPSEMYPDTEYIGTLVFWAVESEG